MKPDTKDPNFSYYHEYCNQEWYPRDPPGNFKADKKAEGK